MGNLETPITWVLGIAFIAYITLGNCCSDSSNQAAYVGTETSINAPALDVEEEVVEEVTIEVTIEDDDTTIVVETEITAEEE